MKSTKFFALSFFATSLLFGSCKKEEKDPPVVRLVSRIDYYRNIDGNVTLDYTNEFRYDEKNRIIEIISPNGSNAIIYPTKNLLVVSVPGSPFRNITYALNDDGFITSRSDGVR